MTKSEQEVSAETKGSIEIATGNATGRDPQGPLQPNGQPNGTVVPSARSNDAQPTTILGLLVRTAIPIVILAGGIAAFLYLKVEPPEKQLPPAEKQKIKTKVATLMVTDYPLTVQTNGIVQPHNEVAFSAEVAGLVTRISPSFEVGAYFEAGEVLVELDSRDYKTALVMAEAQKLGAEAALDLAKETYERNRGLYERKGISQAVLKQSFAAKLQAEAQLESAKAQIERAGRDLERSKVVAPFDGRVRMRNIGVGQSVGTGTPLGMVFAVDFAEVRLPIANREQQFLNLPELATDPAVDVELTDAINPDNKTIWRGRIVRTEGTLDLNSLELFAIARIDDPFGRKSGQSPLRIGQPVIASIAGKTLNDVVAIPREAVRQLDQVYFVNKEGEDLVLQSKKVEPIWSDADQLIVNDPEIQDGQMIATTRIVYAPDGAKCEIIPDIIEDEITGVTKTEDKVADGKKTPKTANASKGS